MAILYGFIRLKEYKRKRAVCKWFEKDAEHRRVWAEGKVTGEWIKEEDGTLTKLREKNISCIL